MEWVNTRGTFTEIQCGFRADYSTLNGSELSEIKFYGARCEARTQLKSYLVFFVCNDVADELPGGTEIAGTNIKFVLFADDMFFLPIIFH